MLNKKAISLLSGGLDSVLATKLMKDQGIEVVALHFTSPFCNCNKGNGGCGLQAVSASKELGVRGWCAPRASSTWTSSGSPGTATAGT